MSVALAEHTGPWTPDDVEALPDSGDHARFEVFEGGVLVASPAPGVAHQRASYWLLAIVEVVSPSTISIDRAIKPAMYAEAAIPVYWRVELHDTPRIVVSTLTRGRYNTRSTLTAGTTGRITKPFPIETDPAHLTRRMASYSLR